MKKHLGFNFKTLFISWATVQAVNIGVAAAETQYKGELGLSMNGTSPIFDAGKSSEHFTIIGWVCKVGSASPPSVVVGAHGAHRDEKNVIKFNIFSNPDGSPKVTYFNNNYPLNSSHFIKGGEPKESFDLNETCGLEKSLSYQPRFRFAIDVSKSVGEGIKQGTIFIGVLEQGKIVKMIYKPDFTPRVPYGAISGAQDELVQKSLGARAGDIILKGHMCYNDWNPFRPYLKVQIKNNITKSFDTLTRDVDYTVTMGLPTNLDTSDLDTLGNGNWWCKLNENSGGGYEITLKKESAFLSPQNRASYRGGQIQVQAWGNYSGLPRILGGNITTYLPF